MRRAQRVLRSCQQLLPYALLQLYRTLIHANNNALWLVACGSLRRDQTQQRNDAGSVTADSVEDPGGHKVNHLVKHMMLMCPISQK